jgi:phage terminase Nu1 subunit (DNA packaging protein)
MKPPTPPTYPVGTIAKLLLLTERRVQQLTKEGVIPRSERGRYDLASAVQGYVRYLQERSVGQSSRGPEADYHAEKTRKIRAEADLAEMDASLRKGELLEADDVRRSWRAVIGVIRAHLLGATPARIAAQVIGRESEQEIKEILRSEIEMAMRGASEGDISDGGDQSGDPAPRA